MYIYKQYKHEYMNEISGTYTEYSQQPGPRAGTEVQANKKAESRGNHERIYVCGGFSRDPKFLSW